MGKKYMLARLKSCFFTAPSFKKDRERFFVHIRDTEAYPTRSQMYGMLECALGYADEYEAEKKELENNVWFGSALRTPYTFFDDYESGEIIKKYKWKSCFLNACYLADPEYFDELTTREDPALATNGIYSEFRARLKTATGAPTGKSAAGSNSLELFVLGRYNGADTDAGNTVCKELGLPIPGEWRGTRVIDGVSFAVSKDTLHGKTRVVGAHVYPNSYLAVVIVAEADTDDEIETLFGGFRYFYTRERKPYRRIGDLRTAQALFSYQYFESANGGKADSNPAMTTYYYLCDADFLVPIYADEEWLDKIDLALDLPIFIYYFGDRKCIPMTRVNNGIWEEQDVSDKICV